MPRAEKYHLENLLIDNLLNEKYLKMAASLNMKAIALASIHLKKEGDKIMPTMVLLNHQSDKEIENKILHVECADSEVLTKFINGLTELGAK
jgi:hypothetical protein